MEEGQNQANAEDVINELISQIGELSRDKAFAIALVVKLNKQIKELKNARKPK